MLAQIRIIPNYWGATWSKRKISSVALHPAHILLCTQHRPLGLPVPVQVRACTKNIKRTTNIQGFWISAVHQSSPPHKCWLGKANQNYHPNNTRISLQFLSIIMLECVMNNSCIWLIPASASVCLSLFHSKYEQCSNCSIAMVYGAFTQR